MLIYLHVVGLSSNERFNYSGSKKVVRSFSIVSRTFRYRDTTKESDSEKAENAAVLLVVQL